MRDHPVTQQFPSPGLDRLLPPGANPLDPHWLEIQRRFAYPPAAGLPVLPHGGPGGGGANHLPGVYPPVSLAGELAAREREKLERLGEWVCMGLCVRVCGCSCVCVCVHKRTVLWTDVTPVLVCVSAWMFVCLCVLVHECFVYLVKTESIMRLNESSDDCSLCHIVESSLDKIAFFQCSVSVLYNLASDVVDTFLWFSWSDTLQGSMIIC